MENEKKKSLSLVAYLIMMIGAGFAIMTAVQVFSISKIAKADSKASNAESYRTLADALKLAIDNNVEGYFKDLQVYVHADVMKDGDLDAAIQWMLDNTQVRASEYDYMMITGPDGKAVTDQGKPTEISTRDYFQAIMKQGKSRYVDNPVTAKTTGKTVIHVSEPLKDRDGNRFGMITGIIPLETLIKPVKELNVPAGVWQFMLDHDGNVMYHPYAADGGNFLTSPGEGHEDLIPYSQKMVNGESGYGWIKSYTGNGQDLLVYDSIKDTPWAFGFTVAQGSIEALGDKIAAATTAFGIGVLFVILILGGVVLVVALRPLRTVRDTIRGIATGNADLTQRIAVSSNNEIGQVVHGFNQFTEKLQNIIKEVKASKNELGIAGSDMAASANDTASAINQIIANIDSFGQQIDNQKKSVDQTAGAVDEISANIDSLNHMIEGQSSGVSQASSAVEQLIGNINAVTSSVERMKEVFGDLHTHSQEGFSKLEAVSQKVAAIESQSATLQDANTAISSIAEQTNLLAMNAAIEAAHAGEAGKGFAVVADEIRQLAETSSTQSDEIKKLLGGISSAIMEIVTSSQKSAASFESVGTKILQLDGLIKEVRDGMKEQNIGVESISSTMHTLDSTTAEITTSSAHIKDAARKLSAGAQDLEHMAEETKVKSDEAKQNMDKMRQSANEVVRATGRNNDATKKVSDMINGFKV